MPSTISIPCFQSINLGGGYSLQLQKQTHESGPQLECSVPVATEMGSRMNIWTEEAQNYKNYKVLLIELEMI